ncbi:MAG: YdcF family protein [Thomasclavelia sp.]|nr:YdcF family protein [Thomasclavelia sp.]
MEENIAKDINVLSNFCGKRDLVDLTTEELKKNYSIEQADIMVLFGGSIICGGDVIAEGIKNDIAKKYIIVGGGGHTTDALRNEIAKQCPNIETKSLSEAKLFSKYLEHKYGLEVDYLETHSTNCGNNITYLLDLLKRENISYKSIIISQDASMQLRMEMGLRKYVKDKIIINYATYKSHVVIKNNKLVYEKEIVGMWDIERYISLLMGEIVRLRDDENGYGPSGKNYIEHVDIPIDVEKAYKELEINFRDLIRKANPLYASKNRITNL